MSISGFATSLVAGLAITGATMLVPYTYCQNGDGRGIPFSAVCPSCGATRAAIGRVEGQYNQVLDPLKLGGNVLLWTGAIAGTQSWLRRRRLPKR